ncbi:MAG: hypothetical protein ABWZ99_12210 [Ilumatobacteraceae bacterium]
MNDPSHSGELAAVACSVRALTDQFGAFQRDRRASAPTTVGDTAVADLMMLVQEVQRDVARLREELRSEIRTASIVVDDGVRQVVITPGRVIVERRPDAGDARSGSLVHIQSLVRAAEVTVEAASAERDFGTTATMNANWEDQHPVALVSAQTDLGSNHQARELRVEDHSTPEWWRATS